MEWANFESRLQRTLLGLPERTFLILSMLDAEPYAQIHVGATVLAAEAAGPGVARVAEEAEAALRDVGWLSPTTAQPNWSLALELPALASEVQGLSAACVVALRDVFGASSPDALVYRAWREKEFQPPGVMWQAKQFTELDPGEDPVRLRELGIDMAFGPHSPRRRAWSSSSSTRS